MLYLTIAVYIIKLNRSLEREACARTYYLSAIILEKYLNANSFQITSQMRTITDAIPATAMFSKNLPIVLERVRMSSGKDTKITTNPINIVSQTKNNMRINPNIALNI